jgi:hypothetical protein
MERTIIKTFEWDMINKNLYEKTYYYVDDVFVRSEITKVYHEITMEVMDEFFQIDKPIG